MPVESAPKRFLWSATFTVVLAAVGSGCASKCCEVRSVAEKATPRDQEYWLDKYAQVEIGMSRSRINEILGTPTFSRPLAYWTGYGPSPYIQRWQSPQSPNRIVIHYSDHDAVEDKEFFYDNQERP